MSDSQYICRFYPHLFHKIVKDSIDNAKAVRSFHEKPVFDPKTLSVEHGKLNCCPETKIISKFIYSLGKRVRIPVPCGKCTWCNHKRQNALIYRIYNHMRCYKNALFVTLTYNDEHYPCSEIDCRNDATKFYKRLRKKFSWKTFTYFHVCERGRKTGRLHHHFLLFWNTNVSYAQVEEAINQSWQFRQRSFADFKALSQLFGSGSKTLTLRSIPVTFAGFTYFGKVEPSSITYVTKYMNKGVSGLTVFQSWSKGLGLDVLSIDPDLVEKLRYCQLVSYVPDPTKDKRYFVSVPRYYFNKLTSQAERDYQTRLYFDSDYYRAKLAAFSSNEDYVIHLTELASRYVSVAHEHELALEHERIIRGTNI